MRFLYRLISSHFFSDIDRSIEGLQEIRDSYRALNVEIYGEEMASLLNDW
jgi:sulfatase maturation enzyme AslB (radical SAM superfamily)